MAAIHSLNKKTLHVVDRPAREHEADSATPRDSFSIGEEASLSRKITLGLIKAFARVSGDLNPVHLDEEYAKRTRFGGRIAHGMLAASLVSAVLGTQLPGAGAIYLSQQIRFLAPVRPGDTITARVRVTDWDGEKRRLTLLTEVVNDQGTTVATGEAKLLVPAAQATESLRAAA